MLLFLVPMLDKSAADPPPYIVLVQGPPKVQYVNISRVLNHTLLSKLSGMNNVNA